MSRWTDKQDAALRKLVNKNIITYTNLEPNYLFEVTQEHFPDFIGTGASARNTAIQRLCKKFRQLAEEFAINGGRLLMGESIVSFVHAFYNKLLTCLVFQTRKSTKTEKTGTKKKSGNRLTLRKQTKKWQKRSLSSTSHHARQDCYYYYTQKDTGHRQYRQGHEGHVDGKWAQVCPLQLHPQVHAHRTCDDLS